MSRSTLPGRRYGRCAIGGVALTLAMPVLAGPPYRTGDADTSPAGTVGVRVGLVRVQREAATNHYSGPMLRLKLSLADHVELISLVDYSAEDGRFSDGGLALKLASRKDTYSVGVETVALLPVTGGQSGIGVESQLLASIDRRPWRFHASLGALYDARGQQDVRGWRAGVVAERSHGRARFGLELFARKNQGEAVQLQLGTGAIFPADRFKLRLGVHAGLTSEAPDIAATFWVTTETKPAPRRSSG